MNKQRYRCYSFEPPTAFRQSGVFINLKTDGGKNEKKTNR